MTSHFFLHKLYDHFLMYFQWLSLHLTCLINTHISYNLNRSQDIQCSKISVKMRASVCIYFSYNTPHPMLPKELFPLHFHCYSVVKTLKCSADLNSKYFIIIPQLNQELPQLCLHTGMDRCIVDPLWICCRLFTNVSKKSNHILARDESETRTTKNDALRLERTHPFRTYSANGLIISRYTI